MGFAPYMVVTAFKLRVEAALFLPDTELVAQVECDCVVARLVTVATVCAVARWHTTVCAGLGGGCVAPRGNGSRPDPCKFLIGRR